jgi:zinc protease
MPENPTRPEEAFRRTAPGPGRLRDFGLPPVERRTLSNGLTLLSCTARHFPVVTVNVLLEAGGIYESAAQAGVAALTAEALESGAGARSAADIAEDAESLGVSLGSSISWDVAYVGLTGLKSKLEPASEILASVVREPTFPVEEVERLRAERLAEILQRRADPRSLAGEMASRFIFAPDTPFSRPLGGPASTVAMLQRSDVEAFHAARYRPGDTSVLVVGDIGADEAARLVEERFGDWSGAPEPAGEVLVRPRSAEAQLVIIDRPGSVQSELRIGHVGVARATPDYFPIVVMNTILGGAFSSRLNLSLREKHGYTYGVSSGFAMRRSPGSFLISTAVQTEVTAAAVRETLATIDGMRSAEVAQAELDDARNYLAGIFPLRVQTTDGLAARLAELVIYDLPADYFEHYRERVLSVSAPEVLRAAQTHLRPAELAVVVVGDAAKLKDSLAELGLGEPKIYNREGEEL